MFNLKIARSGFSLIDFFRTNKYKKRDILDHPDRFYSFGVILLCGELGSGKSLTANRLIYDFVNVKDDIVVVSNVSVPYAKHYIPYTGLSDLKKVDNGDRGIILFLDEIVNQFPSTSSKDISEEWIELLNLMRKMHMLIIGTGPLFSRLAKPFREQFEYVCICSSFLGRFGPLIQSNYWYKCNVESKVIGDGDQENTHNMQLVKHQVFTIKVEDLERYNTSELVKIVDSEDRNKRRR